MRARRLVAVVLIAVLVFPCYRFFFGAALLPHQGDGSFEDYSWGVWPVAIQGYTISMPMFDLSVPQKGEYQISSLPSIGKCRVALAIRDPHYKLDWRNIGSIGKLHITLIDSTGKEVVAAGGSLSDFRWAISGTRFELNQQEKSFFTPKTHETYRLTFSYSPDPNLAEYRGFIFLQSGVTGK